MSVELKFDGPPNARWKIALAHGAGAGMDSDFMEYFAVELAALEYRVIRFEFPYMALRRQTGKKRPPDRAAVLQETWQHVAGEIGSAGLVMAGKSMGGRVASMVADSVGCAALICLGYPFHPAGRPEKLRVEHLSELQTPTLFLQGERDAFGNQVEVEGYQLSSSIRVKWLADGDHSFKPRKASGRTEQQNWAEAVGSIDQFLVELAG